MGSQYPWPQSRDCSLGVCSIYCPQWCYKIFAPPPRFDFGGNGSVETSSSGINFSPLIIALIGIAASAFILITYYTIISKYCVRRGGNSTTTTTTTTNASLPNNSASSEPNNTGLEDLLIKSIAVHKYRRNDGVVEGLDCSVCLSEFQENESLRLLPKCSHAFHVTCIDTWLKSHSSCPLCRSNISTPAIAIASVEAVPSNSVEENSIRVSTLGYQHTTNQSVLVVQDREEETYCLQNGEIYRLRRSVSLIEVLNSHEHDEDDHDLETGSSKGTASGEQISKFDNITSGVFSLVKGPLGLRRSISTGRFGFTRKCRVGMEKRLKMETNHFLKKPSKFLKPFEKIEQNQEKDEK